MTDSLYTDFIPGPLQEALLADTEAVRSVEGLRVAKGLRSAFPAIETTEALSVVVKVFEAVAPRLHTVLKQRSTDRAFIDQETLKSRAVNEGKGIKDSDYETVIGKRDASGRLVVGPHSTKTTLEAVHIPPFLQGEQITLFGPPDTERMAINAMNTLHRVRGDEPPMVGLLVDESGQVARWGADDEDSQTPIMTRFLSAAENLMGCYDRTLSFSTPQKTYTLEDSRLSIPIKRIPGLALPDGNHLYNGAPLPLHLFDFVTHVWHNRNRPEALVFYVPKIENEEEAAYLRVLIETTEQLVRQLDPDADLATVRILIVFENPRAIFRIREIGAALGPHFLGGSLGWHDFLASAARLFRHDPNYRIPVKADPNIVVHHIKESHCILAEALRPSGAMCIGGMYGVLFEEGNAESFSLSMIGFIRDVAAQMKRGLNGFWVAHPDFVRVGIALVQAWRRYENDPQDEALAKLIKQLVPQPSAHRPLLDFVFGEDVAGLEPDDPCYARSVLAADIEVSPVIANDDPEEIRYNIFQALQYLAAWLEGTGCVALPATLKNAEGAPVFVRIMDDLATTERSRWELWAEIHHQRVSLETFEQIFMEEVAFIREDQSTPLRRVQVKWQGDGEKWYPIAIKLLRQLVTDPEPVEFVPELLLPFTFPCVRDADDPWETAKALCPGRYTDN